MTTRETAEALGVSERTIQKHASNLGYTVNGILTNLDQNQVTKIKNRIGKQDLALSCKVDTINTDVEMIQKAKDFMQWATVKIQEETNRRIAAENKIELDAPKVKTYDKFVSHETFMNFRDAAASIGISQTSFMDLLRSKYIYKNTAGEYRAYNDYQSLFSIRPYINQNRMGSQLMISISGMMYFNKMMNGGE